MSRRIERRKQIFVNWIRIIMGGLLSVACAFALVYYVYNSANTVDAGFRTKADSQNRDVLTVQQIIIEIENGDGKSALEKINAIDSTFSDKAVLEYLKNFRDYYLRHSGKEKKLECRDTLYFVQRSVDLKNFLTANHVQNYISYLEAIPYFCIKYFEQGQNANLKKKNASNLELYESYIKTFIEAGSTTITSSEADIICLYISAKKKSNGNSDMEIGQLQKEIEKIQKDYMNQLGENGTCVRQRDALERMHSWCVDKINKHFISDLLVGFFPSYKIPIEKK